MVSAAKRNKQHHAQALAHEQPDIGSAFLRAALIAGCNAVVAEREALNKINVFPVADGDTGTNLAFTFRAMRENLSASKTTDITELTRRAAMAAIEGSRGNSGAIVAQFFYGFSEALSQQGQLRLGLAKLTQVLAHAASCARRAIAAPREGTMLSVFDAIAKALNQTQPSKLANFIETCVQAAKTALDRTPQQLKVLAEHAVVDAGAKGIWHFFCGVQNFYQHGRDALRVQDKDHQISDQALLEHAHHEPSQFRYCCECVLQGADIEQVRTALISHPYDSLVLAGGQSYARLHVHSNSPAELFIQLENIARVQSRKADDMHAQQRVKANPAKVHVVCDTAADLPDRVIRELSINTVHVRVNFASEEFIDRVTLMPHQLYQRMASSSEPVRTSQPPTGEFLRMFDQLTATGKEVICINVSSTLSGTWQAARAAAVHGGKGRTIVIDSLNAAAGQALLAIDAALAARAGYNAQQIQDRVHLMRPHTRTFAVIPDLSYGVRGGRLPKWVGYFAAFLGAKALIANDANGRLKLKGVLWGKQHIARRFARWALSHASTEHKLRVIIGHCNDLLGAEQIRDYLLSLNLPLESMDVVEAGTAIGAHAGPGALVLGIQSVVDFTQS